MLWLAGGLFLFLRHLITPLANHGKVKKVLWWVPYALLVLGVCALMLAPIPFTDVSIAQGLAYVASWLFGLLGSAIGAPAAAIGGVALFILIVAALVDLIKDQKPDGIAKTAVFLLPVLALVAAGPIAANILDFTHSIGQVGPDVVNTLAS